MTVGIALSGGGITGIIGGLCSMHALTDTFPTMTATVSTVSGGTIGYGVLVNADAKLSYYDYDTSIAYADAKKDNAEDDHIWFANIVNYLNWAEFPTSTSTSTSRETTSALQSSWWTDVIDLAFWEGYSVHDYDITGGDAESMTWLANFALINKDACPIKQDGQGTMKGAETDLVYANMNMNTGVLKTTRGSELKLDDKSVLDVMSYSSSFWAAGILESSAAKYWLMSGTVPTASLDSATVYLNDGGIVDTTGIVSLLQRKTDKIVAFYNNNDPLATLNSTFSDLFGIESTTDSMNSLEGYELGQVFDSQLWPGVIANMTDGSILRARLSNVEVKANAFLGVEAYTLKELVIFSNEYSDAFLDTFTDTQIKENLDAMWPNQFPVSVPVLDANTMCMFASWKTGIYKDELAEVLLE
jgi:hypothetical protein